MSCLRKPSLCIFLNTLQCAIIDLALNSFLISMHYLYMKTNIWFSVKYVLWWSGLKLWKIDWIDFGWYILDPVWYCIGIHWEADVEGRGMGCRVELKDTTRQPGKFFVQNREVAARKLLCIHWLADMVIAQKGEVWWASVVGPLWLIMICPGLAVRLPKWPGADEKQHLQIESL